MPRSWTSVVRSLPLGPALALLIACGESTPASSSIKVLVSAAEGATITSSTGIVVEIPPRALARDTTITVSSFQAAALEPVDGAVPRGLHLGGVAIEPDGTRLAIPARVSFPLPADWDGGEHPVIYEGRGSNPALAFPGGREVKLEGATAAWRAVIEVEHFSEFIPSQNCHSGTIKRLLAAYEAQGCPRQRLLAAAAARFSGVQIDESSAVTSKPPALQAFLDTHFDDFATFNAGQDISAGTFAELTAHVLAGRKVVLAFSPGAAWPGRTAANGFFPSKPFAHSCVLEPDGKGGVQMHHTIIRPRLLLDPKAVQKLVDDLGGELHYTYPLDRLNDYRKEKSGVAFEVAICGTPGCLSDPSRNRYQLDPYQPLEEREVAYPTVHIYLEKEGVAAGPACTGGTAEVTFPDPTGDWTISLALPPGVQGVAEVLKQTTAYNDQWVQVSLPDLPADPAAWDPLKVSITVKGGTVERLRLYNASNNWDPASRSTSYQDFASGDSFSLGGVRYYWLYIYTSDPKFSYDYTMQIFRLVGGK